MAEDDTLERWRRAALETDGAALEAVGRAALAATPDAAALRRASTAAGALERQGPLAAPERERAVALARVGLAADAGEVARWDALHLAAELGLAALAPDVRAILKSPGTSSPSVRGRAAEAYAVLVPAADARTALEPARIGDPDWTVRRLAGEALRAVEARRLVRGDPFGRFKALVRGGRARVDGGAATLPLAAVADAGVALPPAYRLFLVTACGGGRVVLAADDPRGLGKDAASLTLSPPATLRSALAARGPSAEDRRRIQEHVWTRYVDGGRPAAGLDEGWALRQLAERYDGGLVDADLWCYGVLLFEHAFADDARRAERLLRCRSALRAHRDAAPEPWDVVDDRLAEVEETLAREGLAPPADRPGPLVQLGAWEGVLPLYVDLHRPGVFVGDPARPGAPPRRLAGTLLELLEDPLGHAPGAGAAGGSTAVDEAPRGVLGLLDEAEQHLAAGRHKQAGRLFGDALEAEGSEAVLARAAAILTRPDLTPLLAGQLLATVPLVGDQKSAEVLKAVLLALAPERGRDLIEALGPYDDDGSDYALVVDAAVALRGKSHAEVRDAAKRLRAGRGKRHVRTVRNPFYK